MNVNREDYENAQVFKTEAERQNHYIQLKTAAESGWDFSSRWYIKDSTDKGKLQFINNQVTSFQ